MIIQSQDISMQGRRSYRQKTTVSFQQTSKPLAQNGLYGLPAGVSGNGNFLGTLNYYLDGAGKWNPENMTSDSGVSRESAAGEVSGTSIEPAKSSARIQFETLSYLLYIFFMKGKKDFQEEMQEVMGGNAAA